MSRASRQNARVSALDVRGAIARQALPAWQGADPYAPRYPLTVSSDLPTITTSLSTDAGASSAFNGLPAFVQTSDTTALTGRGLLRGARTISGTLTMMNVANGHYAAADPYPTGTPSTWDLEFDFMGDAFTMGHVKLASADKFQMYVDGRPIAATPTALQQPADGVAVYTKFAWGSVAQRRIRITFPSNFALIKFGLHNALHSFRAVPKPPFSALILGDSWVEGTGASSTVETTINYLRLLSGWEIFQAGQGGTGYGVAAADSTLGLTTFNSINRIRAIAEAQPDLVVFAGTSNNDATTTSDLTTYAGAAFDAAAAASPLSKLVAIGPQNTTGTPSATRLARRDAIKAAADARGIPFVDRLAGNWITGTGTTAAPGTSGNASLYVYSDGSHLVSAGQFYEAGRYLETLLPLALAS